MKKVPKISTPLRQLDGREQVLKVRGGKKDFVVLTHMTATAAMSPGWVTTKRLVNGPW